QAEVMVAGTGLAGSALLPQAQGRRGEQRVLSWHLVRVGFQGVAGEVQPVQDGLLAAREEAGHVSSSSNTSWVSSGHTARAAARRARKGISARLRSEERRVGEEWWRRVATVH